MKKEPEKKSEAVAKIDEITSGVKEHLSLRKSNIYLENLTDSINEIKHLVHEHALEAHIQMEALGAIYDALVEGGFHETAADLATQYEL